MLGKVKEKRILPNRPTPRSYSPASNPVAPALSTASALKQARSPSGDTCLPQLPPSTPDRDARAVQINKGSVPPSCVLIARLFFSCHLQSVLTANKPSGVYFFQLHKQFPFIPVFLSLLMAVKHQDLSFPVPVTPQLIQRPNFCPATSLGALGACILKTVRESLRPFKKQDFELTFSICI